MAASLLGGIALGGYTTGGFSAREAVDVIGNAVTRVRHVEPKVVAFIEGPTNHVCTGCDAKLYREDDWYRNDVAYQTDDEWAREERENRQVVLAALNGDPGARAPDAEFDPDEDAQPYDDTGRYSGTVVARLEQ